MQSKICKCARSGFQAFFSLEELLLLKVKRLRKCPVCNCYNSLCFLQPTYLPVWIIIAFLSLGAVYRYKTTKAREDAFQAKKLKEEEEKRQKDKAAKASKP